ncbi:hypothetical protein [Acinetobacter sp.]|uniref:hypothetical protein n=1 Tax=Acinetobacter sp. TaxID=472 RepID=UPI003982CA91
MEINQLKPVDVLRDECGQWVHPDYLKYLDEHFGDAESISQEQWDELKCYFNIQTVTLWLSASVTEDDFEEIMLMENTDLSKWTPNNPDGFFLIDIGYTEEDAQAIFARPIRETELA